MDGKQKVVEKRHRFGGRNAFVVHVARDSDEIGQFARDYSQYLVEDVFLVFDHRIIVHTFAYMKV